MSSNVRTRTIFTTLLSIALSLVLITCSKDNPGQPEQTVVCDWGQPSRLGDPINTPCPQDAIEISRYG